ncbi:MAG: hypothetical protein EZS28_034758 [Streblomastix strix]|uniref:Uncharacterized protein n=1 Tax=Streblomastix strix TaxID=222440 RepID=A0A5J4UHU0_9EUKA|nr:MAG: hypothetical protein EZS28_034758 [Streblomastix strix]
MLEHLSKEQELVGSRPISGVIFNLVVIQIQILVNIDNQWMIGTIGNKSQNQLGFTIVNAGQEGQVDRGLQISADGNTLTFNGQDIAGTGAAVGSVNYSQGNPILWDVNSTETDSGFYNNGTTIFWRDHALQFDPYYQEQ